MVEDGELVFWIVALLLAAFVHNYALYCTW
jgi:hypothetical protein